MLTWAGSTVHTMGAPLALTDQTYATKAWTLYRDCNFQQSGVQFIHARVLSVNPDEKVVKYQDLDMRSDTPREICYDFLVTATGTYRPSPVVPDQYTKQKYLVRNGEHFRDLHAVDAPVIVVGGGAVGVETAAEMARAYPSKRVILVHSRQELLSSEPLPAEYKNRVKFLLQQANIDLYMGRRFIDQTRVSTDNGKCSVRVTLSSGEVIQGSTTIFCFGRETPNTEFLPLDFVNDEGFVVINPDLSFAGPGPNAPDHFAVGDAALWNGIKSVGGALFMGQCAAINIVGRIGARNAHDRAYQLKPVEIPSFPLLMYLAVGKSAVSLEPDGSVRSGCDIHDMFFGEDLGLQSKQISATHVLRTPERLVK
ncbi:hypothetical protein APSETT444_003246 [Aspergillus pseudonomiae]